MKETIYEIKDRQGKFIADTVDRQEAWEYFQDERYMVIEHVREHFDLTSRCSKTVVYNEIW